MKDKWIDLSEIIDLDKKEEKETEYLEEMSPDEFYECFREEFEEMEKKFVDKKASEILQTLQDKIISQTQLQIQTQNSDDEVLGKEDIKQIMNYKDDGTALRFLRVATKYGYAAKVGKSYKITRKNLNKFLKYMEGQDFEFK